MTYTTRYNLSLLEQKIILYALSKLDTRLPVLPDMEISVTKFCKVCGISQTNLTNLKRILQKLQSKNFWVLLEDGSIQACVSWFGKLHLVPNSDIIRLRFHDDLHKYLLELKAFYVRYSLGAILAMSSKYSIRVYELLRSYLNLRYLEMTVDDLKYLLCAERYTRFNDFKRFVLETAVNEINLLTDISVSWEGIKGYRGMYKAIYFNINKKSEFDKMEAEQRANELLQS